MTAHLARTARPVAALVGKAISRTVLPYTSSCAVPVLGGAGRHGAKAIAVPGKICPVHLPPCRTGLNPVGKVSAPSRSPTPVRPSPNRVLKKSTGRRGCLTEMREPLAPVRALCTLAGAIAPATAPSLTQASRGPKAPGQRPQGQSLSPDREESLGRQAVGLLFQHPARPAATRGPCPPAVPKGRRIHHLTRMGKGPWEGLRVSADHDRSGVSLACHQILHPIAPSGPVHCLDRRGRALA